MTVAVFLTAWFLHLIAAASPGPAILMAARIGVTEGRKTGVFLAVGIGLGALFWAVSALFGLALLFEIAPTVLWGFKLAGVLFLFWIALSMWRHADDPLVDPSRVTLPRSPWSALRLGILTQLSNPKPAVFFGAVFVGTIPPQASAAAIGLLLVAIFLNEFVCNLVVAHLFSLDQTRRIYATSKRWIDRSFGSILALIGAKIAVS